MRHLISLSLLLSLACAGEPTAPGTNAPAAGDSARDAGGAITLTGTGTPEQDGAQCVVKFSLQNGRTKKVAAFLSPIQGKKKGSGEEVKSTVATEVAFNGVEPGQRKDWMMPYTFLAPCAELEVTLTKVQCVGCGKEPIQFVAEGFAALSGS